MTLFNPRVSTPLRRHQEHREAASPQNPAPTSHQARGTCKIHVQASEAGQAQKAWPGARLSRGNCGGGCVRDSPTEPGKGQAVASRSCPHPSQARTPSAAFSKHLKTQ